MHHCILVGVCVCVCVCRGGYQCPLMCVLHLIIFHQGHDVLLNSPLYVHLCVHVFSDTSYATHLPMRVCACVRACACSASPRGAALCLPLQFEGSWLIRCLCVLTRWYISSQQHGSLSLHSCWANKPDLCTTPTTTGWSDSYYTWLQRAMIWSTFKQQFAWPWTDAQSLGVISPNTLTDWDWITLLSWHFLHHFTFMLF